MFSRFDTFDVEVKTLLFLLLRRPLITYTNSYVVYNINSYHLDE